MTENLKEFYKVTKLDGFDFHTGKTINYRKNIGKIVTVPKKSKTSNICSEDVLHTSELFFDAIQYGSIPCSVFIVSGTPTVTQNDKCGFKKMKIVKELEIIDFQKAYYRIMIYILNDVKNNFDNSKFEEVTKAIDQTILVFQNGIKLKKINLSAARSAAESAAMSAAESAAESAAMSAARSAAWSAARSAAESAAWSAAMSAAESAAMSAARSAAMSAARSAAESAAWSAARSAAWSAARSAAESAAWSAAESAAWSAARSARSAARSAAESAAMSAKYKEYSEKFVEFLEAKQ